MVLATGYWLWPPVSGTVWVGGYWIPGPVLWVEAIDRPGTCTMT